MNTSQRAREAGLVSRIGPTDHLVRSGPETVQWGFLSALREPVVQVASGDTVTVETVTHEGLMPEQGDPESFFRAHGVRPEHILEDCMAIYSAVQHSALGPHVITGPIAVAGAAPGDTLVVEILEVAPRTPYGVNSMRFGKGALPEEFPYNRSLVVPFGDDGRTALFDDRIRIPLAPFFGILATAPPANLGRVSSGPPGAFGGNLDIKHLVAGSTLYLPVHVPGALFVAGDGHAAQGNGEVNVTALETSLTGRFRLTIRKGRRLLWPYAETPAHWIMIGLDADLDGALRMALRQTIAFLSENHGLTREDAYALSSIAIDFEISQVVNGIKGVHAMIPKAIFS